MDGINAAGSGGESRDFGVVSTPQLHYNVVCRNTDGAYGQVGEQGYYEKLAAAFNKIRGQGQPRNGNYDPKIYFDGANGVGALKMKAFLGHLRGLDMEVVNDGSNEDKDVLNFECGADFVKVNQKPSRGLEGVKGVRCVAVDGDADRVMYFYNDERTGQFFMLDGDKIATLSKAHFAFRNPVTVLPA